MTRAYKPRLSLACENDFLIPPFLSQVIFLQSFLPSVPLCVRINGESSFGYCPVHSLTTKDYISHTENLSCLDAMVPLPEFFMLCSYFASISNPNKNAKMLILTRQWHKVSFCDNDNAL